LDRRVTRAYSYTLAAEALVFTQKQPLPIEAISERIVPTFACGGRSVTNAAGWRRRWLRRWRKMQFVPAAVAAAGRDKESEAREAGMQVQ
jgi:hypothetical protein